MKVLVFDKIYVPGHGMGPFITPIEIEDPREVAVLGTKSRIKVVYDLEPINEKEYSLEGFPIRIKKDKEINILPELNEPDYTVPYHEEKEEKEEEVIEEEAPLREELVEKVVKEDKSERTKEELDELTVSELKLILDEMKVPYLYKETKNALIDKILENQ